MKRRSKVTESITVKKCVEYAHKHGWRCYRKNVGLYYTKDGRPIRIGQKGECDWLLIKPSKNGSGFAAVAEIEFKGPNGRVSDEQREYLAKMEHIGIKTLICRNFEHFCCFLRAMELCFPREQRPSLSLGQEVPGEKKQNAHNAVR